MHSSRNLLVLVVALASACSDEPSYDCDQSVLTYRTFGEPFIADWCRGCHSEQLYPTMRQDAPLDVNLDTIDQVRARKRMILDLAGERALMPPSGGPSTEERALLREWISCGAR
jgi:uncharacterized membrane protein